jgi:hypothetical protein
MESVTDLFEDKEEEEEEYTYPDRNMSPYGNEGDPLEGMDVDYGDGGESMQSSQHGGQVYRPRATSSAGISNIYNDVRAMPGFDTNHMGQNQAPAIPLFPQCRLGSEANHCSYWKRWLSVEEVARDMKPVRTLCAAFPVSLLNREATHFRDWDAPTTNATRATSIAAVLSFVFGATTGKGFPSGNHAEFKRANGDADEDDVGEASGKDKKPKRVHQYVFTLDHDESITFPMFIFGYEELYNQELTQVTAIRVWKFVSTGALNMTAYTHTHMHAQTCVCVCVCNAPYAHEYLSQYITDIRQEPFRFRTDEPSHA